MVSQTLLQFLQQAPPVIQTQNTTGGRNTTSMRYNWRDTHRVTTWDTFTYDNIIQKYGRVLDRVKVNTKRVTPSTLAPIRDEEMFRSHFFESISPKIRTSLLRTFARLPVLLREQTFIPVSLETGSAAILHGNFRPDLAIVKASVAPGTSVNRCPGDMKVSWKWRSAMRYSGNRDEVREYKQVLSQLQFYMRQNRARYGYIVTDTELVVVKRMRTPGHLAVSNPIPWGASGRGQFTVYLALWYLAMLTAEDGTWRL